MTMRSIARSADPHPLAAALPSPVLLPAAAAIAAASPRKILYIIDELRSLGGAERTLFEIVSRMPRDRYECSILTFAANPDLKPLQDCPVPVHVLPLGCTASLRGMKAALELRRFIREQKVDIAHTFFESSDLWAAPIVRMSGCRIVISSRRDMGILRARKHRLAYPLVNRLFHRVLTVSNKVQTFALRERGLSAARVQTVYNGIDTQCLDALASAYDARARFDVGQHAPLITALANIRHVKGLDILVQAVAKLTPRFPGLKVVIAGEVLEPEAMAELSRLLTRHSLHHLVIFTGAVANPYPLLKATDVFVLPSRNEGFSNALVEAMACGCASVVTNVGGNAEAIIAGECGFIVRPGDVCAMAVRIEELLENRELRLRMGANARQRVETNFSMTAMIESMTAVYDNAVREVSR